MKPEHAKQLEELLAQLCEADRLARNANAERARAHIRVVNFVSSLVPVGTSEQDLLDIPAFLRAQPEPKVEHKEGDAMVAGCFCDYCANARMRLRLQET